MVTWIYGMPYDRHVSQCSCAVAFAFLPSVLPSLNTPPISPPPLGPTSTPFKWSSKGAGAESPGECAWADRGPRGVEMKNGDGNLICDYSGNVASLPAGKYMEVGVYREPAENNL
jgi:hypothetical protein